jgi:MFS family permease
MGSGGIGRMAATKRTAPKAEREPDFVGMIERHRESQGFWGKCAAVLMVLGLVIAGYGLTAAVGWRSGTFWLGLFVAAIAVFPINEMLERRDRAAGLENLRGVWRSIVGAADTTPDDVERLSAIIRKTHG